MLFASIYTFKPSASEASIKRLNRLFASWQPPKGYEIKAHYSFADGTGGMTLAETSSEAAMYETILPWLPFLDFRVVPLVEIEKGFALATAAIAWRDSVKG
jgi:hypothetical protein